MDATAGRAREATQAAPLGRVERRMARTRQRILQVAETLVRKRGVAAVTIDEIADAADIARRSFYHYFPSKHEVLVPIARARTRSLNRRIDRLIAGRPDSAEVVAIALRHTLRGFAADPLCAWFILHSGLPYERLREGVGESAARDLGDGVRSGRFHLADPRVLGHLFTGALVGVLNGYLEGVLEEGALDDMAEYVLRALGVPTADAAEIAHRPLPDLPGEREDAAAAAGPPA